MDKINLNKKQYNKNQYEKVIDTKFNQLIDTTVTTEQPIISVQKFFEEYQQLFFDISKTGEFQSHEYLIKQSSEYIGFTPVDDTIQALIEEINDLQQQNLELNQQIIDLSTPPTT